MSAANFEAVILAAGKGSRMTELTSHLPKCLLPVGNLPLIWYPLRALELCGVTSVLIVYPEASASSSVTSLGTRLTELPERYGLSVRVRVTSVGVDQDLGTADTLRLLAQRKLLSRAAGGRAGCCDLLLLSCDVVSCCQLRPLLATHQLRSAALTALLSSRPLPVGGVVPGARSKHQPERDVISVEASVSGPGRLLCRLSSEADYDGVVPVRLRQLRRVPRQMWRRRQLLDTHVYCLAGWVVEYLCHKASLASIKGELLPRLINEQFKQDAREQNYAIDCCTAKTAVTQRDYRDQSAAAVTEHAPGSAVKPAQFLRPLRYQQLVEKLSQHGQSSSFTPTPGIGCYCEMSSSAAVRVNTVAAFMTANKHALLIWQHLHADSLATRRLSDTADLRHKQVVIDDQSVVGDEVVISDQCKISSSVMGARCRVAVGVQVSDSVLMEDVSVGDSCVIHNCVLMAGCSVLSGAQLRDCIVSPRHQVAAHARFSKQVVAHSDDIMEV